MGLAVLVDVGHLVGGDRGALVAHVVRGELGEGSSGASDQGGLVEPHLWSPSAREAKDNRLIQAGRRTTTYIKLEFVLQRQVANYLSSCTVHCLLRRSL